MRHRALGQACGVALPEGPMAGFVSRVMVIVNAKDGRVRARVRAGSRLRAALRAAQG